MYFSQDLLSNEVLHHPSFEVYADPYGAPEPEKPPEHVADVDNMCTLICEPEELSTLEKCLNTAGSSDELLAELGHRRCWGEGLAISSDKHAGPNPQLKSANTFRKHFCTECLANGVLVDMSRVCAVERDYPRPGRGHHGMWGKFGHRLANDQAGAVGPLLMILKAPADKNQKRVRMCDPRPGIIARSPRSSQTNND